MREYHGKGVGKNVRCGGWRVECCKMLSSWNNYWIHELIRAMGPWTRLKPYQVQRSVIFHWAVIIQLGRLQERKGEIMKVGEEGCFGVFVSSEGLNWANRIKRHCIHVWKDQRYVLKYAKNQNK